MREYTLPRWKRFNWPLGRWRHVRARVYIWSALAVLIVLLYFGEAYFWEKDARNQAEAAHRALIADIKRFDVMGAPGTTMTDWKEGTAKWKK